MMRRPVAAVLLFAVAALATAPIGYLALWSSFTSYDDEGVLLVTLRSYARGLPLYDAIHAPYGPAYYQLLGGAFARLGLAYTHTTGRWVTLALWLASSIVCAGTTLRTTGRFSLALCVQLLVFAGLAAFPNEPLHPGHVLALLLCCTFAATSTFGTRRHVLRLVGVGAAAGAACLMKVNVGAFLVLSLGFVLSVGLRGVSTRRWLLALACLAFAAAPGMLMARGMSQQWVRLYAFHVSSATLAVAIAIATSTATTQRIAVTGRDVAWVVAGFVIILATSCALAVHGGTVPLSVLNGTLLDPIRLPTVLAGPLELPRGAVAWALASLVLCVVTCAVASRSTGGRMELVVGLGRLAAGVAIGTLGAGRTALAFSLPLAWVAVAPRRDGANDPYACWFLAAIAVLQPLHAYPVAGSQVGWGTFLLVPLAAVCVHQGWQDLARWRLGAGIRSVWSTVLASTGGPVLVVAVALSLVLQWRTCRALHAALVPLALPGAEQVRTSRSLAATYQWLTGRVRERCTTFIAIPGLSSLYLFSDREPPTGANAGVWVMFLDPRRQEDMVHRLEQLDGLCAIRNRLLLYSWTGVAAPDGPLWRYVDRHFRRAEVRNGYEFMVPAVPGS